MFISDIGCVVVVESPGFEVMLLLLLPLVVSTMERWTAARDTGWRAEELDDCEQSSKFP